MSFVRSEEENLWRNVAREKGLNSSQFRVTFYAYSTLAYLNDIPIRFRLKNAFYLWRKGSYLFAYNLIVQANFMLLFCLFNVGLNDVHIQLRLNNVFYSHVLFDDDRPCTAIIQIFTVKCFNYEMLNVESLSILAEDLV